jgi:hypothetical protein
VWQIRHADPPQTAMFHVPVRRPLEPLREAGLDLATETRVWVWLGYFKETADPAVQLSELTVTEATFAVSSAEARELWAALLERASTAPAG